MNTTTAGRCSIAAFTALVLTTTAHAQTVPPAAAAASVDTISDAIGAGKLILELRPRFEDVDQSNFTRNASALTLRTHLGWETGAWNGFSALVEMSDVSHIGAEHYNTTVNGKTLYPTIADPDQVRLNRAQMKWAPSKNFSVTLGRQRITLDDQRFIGDVNWRQNEQTFDAARVDGAYGPLQGTYIYIGHVNRVFGDTLDWQSQSHIANLSYTLAAPLKLTGFYYALDFTTPTAAAKAASTATTGAKLSGKLQISPVLFTYAATYARQTNYGVNTKHFGLDYWEGDLAGTYNILTLKAEYESLAGDGIQGFATPLATIHPLDGWDDVFLTTPVKGLVDTSGSVIIKPPVKLKYFFNDEFTVRYHDFQTEQTSQSLGSEWDLQDTASITKRLSVLVKFADYRGVVGTPSRTKVWFGFDYNY
jgi:hypothetical protein